MNPHIDQKARAAVSSAAHVASPLAKRFYAKTTLGLALDGGGGAFSNTSAPAPRPGSDALDATPNRVHKSRYPNTPSDTTPVHHSFTTKDVPSRLPRAVFDPMHDFDEIWGGARWGPFGCHKSNIQIQDLREPMRTPQQRTQAAFCFGFAPAFVAKLQERIDNIVALHGWRSKGCG